MIENVLLIHFVLFEFQSNSLSKLSPNSPQQKITKTKRKKRRKKKFDDKSIIRQETNLSFLVKTFKQLFLNRVMI